MRANHDHLRDDELLLLLDGELPHDDRAAAREHLDACEACQSRRVVYTRIGRRLSAHGDAASSRDALRARLDATPSIARPRPWTDVAAAAGLLAAVAALVAFGGASLAPVARGGSGTPAAGVEAGALPVPALTPGATLVAEARDLCAGEPRRAEEIAQPVRLAVLRAYGMEGVPADEYELDYLITPELGGSPDARNLWPQRYAARVWNAGVKDQLEDLLPRLVCEGRIDLKTAQRDIAADWIAAYRKYFHTAAPLVPAALARLDTRPIPVFPDAARPSGAPLAGGQFPVKTGPRGDAAGAPPEVR